MGAGEQLATHGQHPGALSGRVRIAPDREMELSVGCFVRSVRDGEVAILPPESLLVQITRFGVALGQKLAEAHTPPDELRLRAMVDSRHIAVEVHARGAGLDEEALRQMATESAAQREKWNGPRADVQVQIAAVSVFGIEPTPASVPGDLQVAGEVEPESTRRRRRLLVWGGLAAAVLALLVVAIVVDSRAPGDQPTSVAGITAVPPTAVAAARAPTVAPTLAPQTPVPSTAVAAPAAAPPPTLAPTSVPTLAPASVPTLAPASVPTLAPTVAPTSVPTLAPTSVPTLAPTAAPTLAPTAAPTVVPTAVPTVPSPRTLLDARFASGALAGWPNATPSVAWFAPDGYHLRSRAPGRFVAIDAPNIAAAGALSVTLRYRKVSGPSGGGVGIILRDQDPASRDGLDQGGRFYVLEVSDRGEVGIWRREVDTWIDLVGWTRSDAVQPATAGNVLEARASGQRLTLLVNGREVATATDAVLTSGAIGVFLGGDDNEAVLEQLTVQSLD